MYGISVQCKQTLVHWLIVYSFDRHSCKWAVVLFRHQAITVLQPYGIVAPHSTSSSISKSHLFINMLVSVVSTYQCSFDIYFYAPLNTFTGYNDSIMIHLIQGGVPGGLPACLSVHWSVHEWMLSGWFLRNNSIFKQRNSNKNGWGLVKWLYLISQLIKVDPPLN